MTLKVLINEKKLKLDNNAYDSSDVGIAFAIDALYLPLWKVAICSLINSNNFIDSPITIYTDDAKVANDVIVKKVADHICIIDSARRDLLYKLAKDNVKRQERAHWNKGTFLKWAVFEEHPTSSVLFLDVDIIFLKKFDNILTNLSKKPFVCSRQYHGEHRKNNKGDRLSFEESEAVVNSMIRCEFDGWYPRSVNSGMLLLSGKTLKNSFFNEITRFASERILVNEQRHFTEYFRDNVFDIDFVSTSYNFQETTLDNMDWSAQHRILEKINILHYAGGQKPWNSKLTNRFRPTQALWHWHHTIAKDLLIDCW